jgi:hypothetical protein
MASASLDRRDASPFRAILAIACLAAVLLLSSCIDMDATIAISADSSVKLHAVYSISTLAFPLFSGSSGGFAVNPPLSRKDLDGIASRIAGMKVTAYSEASDAIRHAYDYSLEFQNPDSLCSFLRLTAGNAVFANENGRKKLSIEIPSLGGVTDQELVSRLEVLFGEYSARLVATLPVAVQSAPGAKVEGRTATFQTRVVDFVKSGKNLDWVLSW